LNQSLLAASATTLDLSPAAVTSSTWQFNAGIDIESSQSEHFNEAHPLGNLLPLASGVVDGNSSRRK
jgi:hypothetical protein